MGCVVLPGLDAARYSRHLLHGENSIWPEKNCYVDLWIEVVHACGLEPRAMLPFTLAIDFEGDQWTFFKPPHCELRDLYGLDVQELTVWQPLIEHAREHLAAGKLISTEADAFWLPDTAGTDYRRQHTKTTIVLNELDVAAQRLGYFHNAGYYSLEGEDFVKTFRLDAAPDPAFLPLFAEIVRLDRKVKRAPAELAVQSRALLRKHLNFMPTTNPFAAFRERFERDLPQLQERGLAFYHLWAFGTIRQAGAAFELAAQNLRWLMEFEPGQFEIPVTEFEKLAAGGKTFILKAARAVSTRRPFDGAAMFAQLCESWERGISALDATV